MPMLANSRYEAVAQGLARGKSQTQAALDAGYSMGSAAGQGCRIAARPEVQARIMELREKLEEQRSTALAKVEMPTRKKVLEELVQAQDAAKQQGNLQAQLRALELLGKELGMFIQRSEVRVESPLEGLNAGDLAGLLAALRQGDVEVVESTAEEVLDADPLA
ncbi:terminase small subunit [Microcystis phage MJing1]|nr:terminase small subunit [Microcystis phage MJing1]